MKKLVTYQIDSFTKERFKGNPAGVVLNADGLTDNQMQLIARELNNSETAFLMSPDKNDCDGVIRYFTPKTEVPTCGHATIAAMYAKALENNLNSCILFIYIKVSVYIIYYSVFFFPHSPSCKRNVITRRCYASSLLACRCICKTASAQASVV